MKFNRAARIISATVLSSAIALSSSSGMASATDSDDDPNLSSTYQLEDHFDDYEEAIAVAGGLENLSDHELQEIMVNYL